MFYPYFCQNLGVPGNSVRPLAITTRRTFRQNPAGNYLFRCSFLFTLYSSSTNQIKKPGKVALGCCILLLFFCKSIGVCLSPGCNLGNFLSNKEEKNVLSWMFNTSESEVLKQSWKCSHQRRRRCWGIWKWSGWWWRPLLGAAAALHWPGYEYHWGVE